MLPTTFRHILATLMREACVPVEQRDNWFGWARNARTGDHYEQRRVERDEYLRDALAVVDGFLRDVEQAIGRLCHQAADPTGTEFSRALRASPGPEGGAARKD